MPISKLAIIQFTKGAVIEEERNPQRGAVDPDLRVDREGLAITSHASVLGMIDVNRQK